MALAGVEPSFTLADPWFTCLVAIGLAIRYSKSYALDAQQITERFMFIPTNHIRWEFVKQVLLFDTTNDDPQTKGEPIFVITFLGCDDFNPESDSPKVFLHRYQKIATKIPVLRKKKHIYKEWFEKTYGTVTQYA